MSQTTPRRESAPEATGEIDATVEELVTEPLPKGKRSTRFAFAVKCAVERGMTAADFEALCRANPQGCAAKYLPPERRDELHKRIAEIWAPHAAEVEKRDAFGAELVKGLLENHAALAVDGAAEQVPPRPRSPLSNELPEHLLKVPGLVGEIAKFIVDTALYPQPTLSLGAALILVGLAAGRHIASPTMSGTHLYICGIARSGAGKDHPAKQITNILDACRENGRSGLEQHAGPSQFISMPAVINFLRDHPLAVCCIDEMGAFFKRINSKKASGFEGAISSMFRMLWGSSFDKVLTPQWAHAESIAIFSPALSLFGVSTVAEFYSALEGADIINGLLNRYLVIETQTRPHENPNPLNKFAVPEIIIHQLKTIYQRGIPGAGMINPLCDSSHKPAFEVLDISPEAEQIRRDLLREITDLCEADHKVEPFLVRTAENAIRLATIVTVGQGVDCIEADVMPWAREFAMWSSNTLIRGAGLYIADSEHQATARAVMRVINAAGGFIHRRDLIRALDHRYKAKDLNSVIASLTESGEILQEQLTPTEKGGRPSFKYTLSNRGRNPKWGSSVTGRN